MSQLQYYDAIERQLGALQAMSAESVWDALDLMCESRGGRSGCSRSRGDVEPADSQVQCDIDQVNGRAFVARVCDNGQTMRFSYDADGRPFSIQNPDGSQLVKGSGGDVWYLSRPGRPDKHVPFEIEREEGGEVVIRTPRGVTVAGRQGIVHRAH
jgi:YD repeat-containing protein